MLLDEGAPQQIWEHPSQSSHVMHHGRAVMTSVVSWATIPTRLGDTAQGAELDCAGALVGHKSRHIPGNGEP